MKVDELGRWFEQESRALVLYARQWLEPVEAEDAVQEVFINLVEQRKPPDHMKAWLYRAVRNRAFNRLRARHRREQREDRVATESPQWFEPRPGDALDARQAERALRTLPEAEREAVTLRTWGGLGFEEVASVVQCSVATAFRRYRSGLEQLRKQLEQPCPTTTHSAPASKNWSGI